MSIGEHRLCCVTFCLFGEKPIVSVAYENERISIKIILPYRKCVLPLSRVVHGPIYGRFMDCTHYCERLERKPFTVQPIKRP